VAADAERVQVPQTPLARPAKPVGQEVAILVAEDDVGDDLRLGRIFLDLPPWTKPVMGADPCEQAVEIRVTKPEPLVPLEKG